MRLLQRIARTRVTGREHPVPHPTDLRCIQLDVHQLVHVPQHEHVAVQLDHAVVLDEREGSQFAPAVVEARVVGVVLVHAGEQVLDVLLWDAAAVQRGVAFRGEGVGVEGDEGVGGGVFAEGVGEGEQAREVGGVGYEGRPYCGSVSFSGIAFGLERDGRDGVVPFFESTTRVASGLTLSAADAMALKPLKMMIDFVVIAVDISDGRRRARRA